MLTFVIMDMAQYQWKPSLLSSCLALVWATSRGLLTKKKKPHRCKLSPWVITTCLKSQSVTWLLHNLQTNISAPILGAEGIIQLSWHNIKRIRIVLGCYGTALVERISRSIIFLVSPLPDVSFSSYFFCAFTTWACVPTQAPNSFNYLQMISSSSQSRCLHPLSQKVSSFFSEEFWRMPSARVWEDLILRHSVLPMAQRAQSCILQPRWHSLSI